MSKLRIEYESNPKRCKRCNGTISYEKRENIFCGRSCSVAHSNSLVPKRKLEINSHRACLRCGTKTASWGRKYCSRKCAGIVQRERTSHKIESGERVSVDVLRKYLLDTRPLQCAICNTDRWMNSTIPLVMDHIDGNPSDNSLDNLRLICPNCDHQLPTWGKRNNGFGRKSRGMVR